MDFISRLLVTMKPLRIMLAIAAVILVIFATPPGTPSVYEGMQAIKRLVLPALTPLVFLVFLLDALMNRVWIADSSDEDKKAKHRLLMRIDLVICLAILIAWLPYFIAIWQ